MNADRESDGRVVPAKCSNKGGSLSPAEGTEGRRPTKENTGQTAASQIQSWGNALDGLQRVREAAKRDKRLRFTALLHHVSMALLANSFYALKRQAAPGVDGLTWQEYETNLDKRLEDLHSRVHRGTYRALPSKRTYIPKPDGRQRPLGIAALEDKIVQHAVGTVLNQIYEEDFLGFSYGFRPGRSAHDALDALSVGILRKKVNWVLDADIRDCFGSFSHEWMVKFLQHRIGDRRILRLIKKWLWAGVLEDGRWSETEKGTPQGSVISPLLCNVYLHYVFDLWVQHWRTQRITGEIIVVRYADDSVLGFQYRADAEGFLREWRERLQRFGLELHPDKTRLIEFGRFAVQDRKRRGEGKPETFNFLGFTHICGQGWKNGKFFVLRKTIRERLLAKLKQVKAALRVRMHHPLAEVGRWLRRVVQGYFNYHAVPGNLASLRSFRFEVRKRWLHVIRRCSQKSRMTWELLEHFATQWLPLPTILHPYPLVRFDAKHLQ
ncbi:MAG TPA: group II intron reverse transcriptase/maturase [Candidatus Acidoferrales bacterium]|nr:group II intron reverse transcriptase/maturase [Candidatus Acidoferrales bacterium]